MNILSEFLARPFLNATVLEWIEAVGVGVAAYMAMVLVRRILIRRLGALAARTANPFDDIVVELLRRTRRIFLLVIALWPAVGLLELSGRPERAFRIVVVVVATVQAAIWLGLAVSRLIEAKLRGADPETATTMGGVSFLIRLGLYGVLVLLALSNLGVNVSALIAGLGIGGVAVALALQNILGDLFASMSIVLDKPFVVGDFIVVGDMMGNVEHIGLKTTRIRSLSGEQISFGNGDLLKSRIRNFKRMEQRRVEFRLAIVHGTPVTKLSAIPDILRGLVEAESKVRFDRAHLKSIDESALTFEVAYYVRDADYNVYMDIQQRILISIAKRFEADGIRFAHPTRTVYLQSQTPA